CLSSNTLIFDMLGVISYNFSIKRTVSILIKNCLHLLFFSLYQYNICQFYNFFQNDFIFFIYLWLDYTISSVLFQRFFRTNVLLIVQSKLFSTISDNSTIHMTHLSIW